MKSNIKKHLRLLSEGKDASVLQEGINSKKYTTEVSPSVYLDGNFYNGKEYDLIDIADNSIDKLSYSIDIEDKEWGIKNIYIYNITGDEEIELDLYLVDKDGEDTFETAIIPISWDNVDITEETEQNMITLDKDVSIYLKNDNEGNIFVDKIGVTVLKF